MPHAGLKPAVKLISVDSAGNVFCASGGRNSFLHFSSFLPSRIFSQAAVYRIDEALPSHYNGSQV